MNAKKGTLRSQKAPAILVKHKTKNGKEVILNLQNECGYLAHSGQGKCHALEEGKCSYSHNYDLSDANKKKVPKPPGLDEFLRRINAGERPYSSKPKPGGGAGRSGSEGK